jgi:hypothetical protein
MASHWNASRAPHCSPGVQVPQSMKPPQPSPTRPHSLLAQAMAKLDGVQLGASQTPERHSSPAPQLPQRIPRRSRRWLRRIRECHKLRCHRAPDTRRPGHTDWQFPPPPQDSPAGQGKSTAQSMTPPRPRRRSRSTPARTCPRTRWRQPADRTPVWHRSAARRRCRKLAHTAATAVDGAGRNRSQSVHSRRPPQRSSRCVPGSPLPKGPAAPGIGTARTPAASPEAQVAAEVGVAAAVSSRPHCLPEQASARGTGRQSSAGLVHTLAVTRPQSRLPSSSHTRALPRSHH